MNVTRGTNYDEVRLAYYKGNRARPVFPESWSRQAISGIAQFTEENVEGTRDTHIYFEQSFGEQKMFHYWGLHCLVALSDHAEFYDTLDFVNDEAYQDRELVRKDWFATIPRYMHLKSAVRKGIYNTPVVRRPELAYPQIDNRDGVRKLLGGDLPFTVKVDSDMGTRTFTVALPKLRRNGRWW